MKVEKSGSKLIHEVAMLLRGMSLQADEMSYVGAEIAFVLYKIDDKRFIANEVELLDFLNGLNCSIGLRSDLMRDVVPHWNLVSRLQNRYSKTECKDAIREFANHVNLANINVPSSIVPLITKLLSAEPGGVMVDVACGHGAVLAQALEEDGELNGEAVDINPQNVGFTEMVVAPFKKRVGVYLQSAFDFIADHMWKYDKVFCFPPFGLRMDRSFRWEEFQRMLPGAFQNVSAGCRSELLFALATVAAMKESGRAVMLLPNGALFNQMSGMAAAREYLLNSGYLDCVISLPDRILERTQVSVSLLVFSKKEKRERVTMIDASRLGEKGRRFSTLSGDTIDCIVNAAYGFRTDDNWNKLYRKEISCTEIRLDGYDFNATRYFEKAILPRFENAVRFGDILKTVERGAVIGSKDMDDLVATGNGACYYLSPGNIDSGIISSALAEMRELPKNAPVLEAGDVLLMRTGINSKIAVFDGSFDKPVVPSSNLFVCRLDRERVDPWYLKAFFESDDGRSVISSIAVGSSIKSISVKSLVDLRLPLPPMERQIEIANEYKAKFNRMRELRIEMEKLGRELMEVYK